MTAQILKLRQPVSGAEEAAMGLFDSLYELAHDESQDTATRLAAALHVIGWYEAADAPPQRRRQPKPRPTLVYRIEPTPDLGF
jgi:hypothetical protein